jgi:hypothetical protein
MDFEEDKSDSDAKITKAIVKSYTRCCSMLSGSGSKSKIPGISISPYDALFLLDESKRKSITVEMVATLLYGVNFDFDAPMVFSHVKTSDYIYVWMVKGSDRLFICEKDLFKTILSLSDDVKAYYMLLGDEASGEHPSMESVWAKGIQVLMQFTDIIMSKKYLTINEKLGKRKILYQIDMMPNEKKFMIEKKRANFKTKSIDFVQEMMYAEERNSTMQAIEKVMKEAYKKSMSDNEDYT